MTAPTIQIHVDGETAISLNSGTIYATRYNMVSPTVLEESLAVDRDRNDLNVPSYQNVTESIELLITGANAAAVQTSIWAIQGALDRARQSRRTWAGTRVWLEVQHVADTGTWRSEILAGSLQMESGLDNIGKAKVEATLAITRRPFWEGSLTALHLSTLATSETTDAVTLHNTHDGGTPRNYIHIGATRITGELPTPLKLVLYNGEATSKQWAQLFITNYVWMNPANVDPIVLGSAAVGGATTSYGGDGESVMHRWALTSAQLTDFAGQYCRILARFTSLTANVWLRVRVEFSLGGGLYSTLYQAPAQVCYLNGQLIDIGCVPLPPFGYNTDSALVYLTITGQLTGGWASTVGHVQICPTGMGLYRKLEAGGDNTVLYLETNDRIVDDGTEGRAYGEDDTNSSNWPVVKAFGSPIWGWPGRINRLRVLLRSSTAFPVDDAILAKAYFRPRRLSL